MYQKSLFDAVGDRLVATCLLASCAGAAVAASDSMPEPALETVVVTAQKREQNLRDVPIALSAIDGTFLTERSISSVDSLSGLAPNLTVAVAPTNSATATVAIRGSVQQNSSIVLDPSVGFYVDGVYVGKALGSIFDVTDLERVEVLRGPQGTLYGRNTLAGAINFITRKPSNEYRGSLELGYGNYDAFVVKAMGNAPISDTLFAKVAAQFNKRDGVVDLAPDPTGLFPSARGTVSGRDQRSAQAQLRFVPTDALTLDYSFDYSRTDQPAIAQHLLSVDPNGLLGPNCPFPAQFCIPAYLYADPHYSDETYANVRATDEVKVVGHSLTIAWEIGDITLKSITGYRQLDFNDLPIDVDGTPLALVGGGFDTEYEQFSQELQATGKIAQRVNFVGGLYHFRDDGHSRNPQSYFFDSTQYATQYGSETRAYAIYAQGDYLVTDRITLTAGVRFNDERKSIERLDIATVGTLPIPGCPFPCTRTNITAADDVHHDFSSVTPTAIVNYRLSDGINVYAKYAQGYRSGGYNGEADNTLDTITPYKPEVVDSYEFGVKSSLLNRRLDINVAAFMNKHDDMQLSVFKATSSASSVLANAGSATVQGIEVEANAQLSQRLRIGGSLAYLDPDFDTFIDLDDSGNPVDVADVRAFSFAPEYTASFNAHLVLVERAGGDNLKLLADASYVDEYYFYAYPMRYIPGYTPPGPFGLGGTAPPLASTVQSGALTLVNAALRWDDISLGSGKAWASLWVKNAFDAHERTGGINFGDGFGQMNTGQFNDPRTYGLSVGMAW